MIKGTLLNNCLVCSMAYKIWISITGLMWYNKSKCLFIQSFMHTECMCLRKKKKQKNKTKKTSHAGPVEGKTALRFFVCFFLSFCLYLIAKILLKLVRMHMHMLILNFGGHMCSWKPSLISWMSFFLLDQTLIRLCRSTCMNMLI